VNIGVWYDKWEIKVGDSLIEKIQEGLDIHDYLAIILSPESVSSEWVKRELNSAVRLAASCGEYNPKRFKIFDSILVADGDCYSADLMILKNRPEDRVWLGPAFFISAH